MNRSTPAARAAGVLYLVTHVTSVGAVILYGGQSYAANAALAPRLPVLIGALFEILLAVSVVGTAIALYPLVRTHSSTTAAGYLGLRTLEAGVILTGVATMLPLVARPTTTDASQLSPASIDALRLVHDWTFLIGPGLIVPFHTVLLAWLLWRTRLVPRFVAGLGLIGGPLIGVVNAAVMFGVTDVVPAAVVPVFAWEITLAITLIVRGLREPVDRSSYLRAA